MNAMLGFVLICHYFTQGTWATTTSSKRSKRKIEHLEPIKEGYLRVKVHAGVSVSEDDESGSQEARNAGEGPLNHATARQAGAKNGTHSSPRGTSFLSRPAQLQNYGDGVQVESTGTLDVNNEYVTEEAMRNDNDAKNKVRLTVYNVFSQFDLSRSSKCHPYASHPEGCRNDAHPMNWLDCMKTATAKCDADDRCTFVATATAGFAIHGVTPVLPENYDTETDLPNVPIPDDVDPFAGTRHCYAMSGQVENGEKNADGTYPEEELNVMDRYGFQMFDCSPTLENNCTWDVHMKLCQPDSNKQNKQRCLCVSQAWGKSSNGWDIRKTGDLNGMQLPVCGVGERCKLPDGTPDGSIQSGVGRCSGGECNHHSNEDDCEENVSCRWKRQPARKSRCMNRPRMQVANLMFGIGDNSMDDLADIKLLHHGKNHCVVEKGKPPKTAKTCTESILPRNANEMPKNILGQNGCMWTPSNDSSKNGWEEGECSLYGCSSFMTQERCEYDFRKVNEAWFGHDRNLTALILKDPPCIWKTLPVYEDVCESKFVAKESNS